MTPDEKQPDVPKEEPKSLEAQVKELRNEIRDIIADRDVNSAQDISDTSMVSSGTESSLGEWIPGDDSMPDGTADQDLLVWDATEEEWIHLAKGSDGDVLRVGSGVVGWEAHVPDGTADQDILVWNGTAWTVLAKGAAKQALRVSNSNVIEWGAGVPSGTATNDILYWDGSEWKVLAKGSTYHVLQVKSDGSVGYDVVRFPS